jgi:hypothetical protein
MVDGMPIPQEVLTLLNRSGGIADVQCTVYRQCCPPIHNWNRQFHLRQQHSQ